VIGDDMLDALMYSLLHCGKQAATTSTAARPKATTAQEILARIEAADKALNAHRREMEGEFKFINGQLMAKVMCHNLPPTVVPNRVHKRRKGQSLQYHRRVQKKWTKRWGTREQQHAYLVDSSVFEIVPGPRRQMPVLPEGWP